MSEQRVSKYVAMTLAASTCLIVAFSAQAVEASDDSPALFQMAGTRCHPARGHCVKFAPNPAAAAQPVRPATEEQLVLQIYEEPFAASCHPAIRPCSTWQRTRLNPPTATAK